MNKSWLKEKINLSKHNSNNERNVYMLKILIIVLFVGIVCIFFTGTSINTLGDVSKNAWNVHFENIVVGENNIDGAGIPLITSNGTDIDFQVALSIPGDVYEFYVDVVNNGNIHAMVQDVGIVGFTEAQKKYLEHKIIYSEGNVVEKKDSLPAGGKETVKVSIKYRDDVDESVFPTEDENISIELILDYEEDDGTSNKRTIYKHYTINEEKQNYI